MRNQSLSGSEAGVNEIDDTKQARCENKQFTNNKVGDVNLASTTAKMAWFRRLPKRSRLTVYFSLFLAFDL